MLSSLQRATTLGIVTVSAIGLNYWLKLLVGRARPALWDRLIHLGLHSLSWRSCNGINCYVWLSGLFSSKPISATAKRNFWLTAILVSAIGFSRLYLGVHWLTNVTAGYAIGLVWLIVCILSLQLSVAQTW